MKVIRRKEILRSIDDANDFKTFEVETIKNEYEEIDFDNDIYENITENLFEDYEMAQENGVYYDLTGILHTIDVELAVEYLNDRINDKWTDDEDEYISEKLVRDYLLKFKGSVLWF